MVRADAEPLDIAALASIATVSEATRPVTDVCFETGFGSLGTFSRTFAVIVGESPSAYRQRGVVPPVPSCFTMAWTRPSTHTHPEASSSGEARARHRSVPSAP